MRAVKLYADGDGDKHDEGAGEVVRHRIDEGAFEREAALADQDCEQGGIEDRRFEDHRKRFLKRTFLLSSDQCDAMCSAIFMRIMSRAMFPMASSGQGVSPPEAGARG